MGLEIKEWPWGCHIEKPVVVCDGVVGVAQFVSREDAELFVQAKEINNHLWMKTCAPAADEPAGIEYWIQKAGIPEDAYRDGGSEANKFIEAMAHDAAKSPLPPSAKSLLSGKPFKAMSGFTSFKVRVSEPLPEPDVGEPCNVCGAERCECLPKPDAIVEK